MQVTAFRKTCISLAVSSSLAISSTVLAGGGGGLTGGAMEFTQMANNAELIAQVGEAASTTANTLQSAMGIMNQLKQFDPATIANMTGIPIKDVATMATAYKTMSKAAVIYKDAAKVLDNHASTAQALDVGSKKLLEMKAFLAKQEGGIHKQMYEQETSKLKQLQAISGDVQEQATNLQRIDSTVGGVQFLASQNVKVQGLMVQLNDSVATANANAAQIAESKKNQDARDADIEKARLEALKYAQTQSATAARIAQDRNSDARAKVNFQARIDEIQDLNSDARAKANFQARIDEIQDLNSDARAKENSQATGGPRKQPLTQHFQKLEEEDMRRRESDPVYAAQAQARDAAATTRRAEEIRQRAAAEKAATEKAIADHNWKLANDPAYVAEIRAREDQAAAARAALEAKGVRVRCPPRIPGSASTIPGCS